MNERTDLMEFGSKEHVAWLREHQDDEPDAARLTTVAILETIQEHVGGCREWLSEESDCCWAPAEYVLWGKLIPAEGLGPRCYDHAAKHVGHDGLRPNSSYALVNVRDLARAIEEST